MIGAHVAGEDIQAAMFHTMLDSICDQVKATHGAEKELSSCLFQRDMSMMTMKRGWG